MSVKLTPPSQEHNITVVAVNCACGTPGHKDLVVECFPCGFSDILRHGTREQAQRSVLYHRIASIERVLGMKVEIEWKPGT